MSQCIKTMYRRVSFPETVKMFSCSFRLKQLREEPYTQAEAERAAGMGSYVAPKTVEVHTQQVEEDMD